ncbi:hypothetical protein M404DRAFT_998978 [Pisolithus tinctorius Marx 270]|uniref:Uncharacterized protein n=1 Tax=Pisolithus tinctorius Marx 270 TaxID=870435 RepID=A0A0C3PDX6_PISTI|nr:hypothetical protein M404DRAFT_998978 [Pisolithus tinctorius Marx 270]
MSTAREGAIGYSQEKQRSSQALAQFRSAEDIESISHKHLLFLNGWFENIDHHSPFIPVWGKESPLEDSTPSRDGTPPISWSHGCT